MKYFTTLLILLAACSNDTNSATECPSGQSFNPISGLCVGPASDVGGLDVNDTGVTAQDQGSDLQTPDAAPDLVQDLTQDVGSDTQTEDAGPDVGQPVDMGGTELCANGRDDNGDGDIDCLDAQCAPTAGCGMCTFVAKPEDVPEAPLDGEMNPGRYETRTAGGFTDDYIYNQADSFKIGTRREWGGTIVFFGQDNGQPGTNNTNVIDANDTGREVQVAFYDPDRRMQNCAWNASCVTTPTTCENSITFLGWNPVQGGNRCNKGSGVEVVDFEDGALTISTLPLQWNPNWQRQDCSSQACNDPALNMLRSDVRVVQKLRFVREHVVELEYALYNLAAISHGETAQEFPTIYPANGQAGPDLWRLFNSTGTEVAIDQPANDGFKWKPFDSPGGWVAMLNQNLDYGVGHYTENRLTRWQGWQLRSLPFNNFRPEFPFAIPANGTIRARSYLILGGKSTVESEANWLDQNLPPFGVADLPTQDQVVNGNTLTVQGWALDNNGVSRVEALVDGGAPTVLSYGQSRPDVCAVWPMYPGCANGAVGYSGIVDVSNLTSCAHFLEVIAVDTLGNRRVIERRRFIKP